MGKNVLFCIAAGVLGWPVPGRIPRCSGPVGQLCRRHQSGRFNSEQWNNVNAINLSRLGSLLCVLVFWGHHADAINRVG
jgi:hypothetical protein